MHTGYLTRGGLLLGTLLIATVSACAHGTVPWMTSGGDVMVAPSAETLIGTEWTLTELGGHGVLDYAEATLRFPEFDNVAGNGSCNRFTGTVEMSGETFNVSPLATTRRVCPAPIMAQEIKYLQALEDADRIVMDGTDLLIYTPVSEYPLHFVRR